MIIRSLIRTENIERSVEGGGENITKQTTKQFEYLITSCEYIYIAIIMRFELRFNNRFFFHFTKYVSTDIV